MKNSAGIIGLLLFIAAATPMTALADDVPWHDFNSGWTAPDSGTDPGQPGTTGNPFRYHEILINGGFETGDLFAWSIATLNRDQEWGVLDGSAGQVAFGSSDDSFFATPWSSGGSWVLGQSSTLEQTGVLPPDHTGTALVRFEAIWAYDQVRFDLTWVDEDLNALERVDLGTFGGRPDVGNDAFQALLTVPAAATSVRFSSTAVLADGTWIDAGFDHASIVMATPVPEPAGVLAMAGLAGLLLRRRR